LVPDTRSLSLSKWKADIAMHMSCFEGNEAAPRRVCALAIGLYCIGEGKARLVTVLAEQAHLSEIKWLRDAFRRCHYRLSFQ
jgi:hypothetical protein